MMRCLLCLQALACVAQFAFAPHAAAWGDQGHQIVALVARHYLTPSARHAVDALLAADRDTLTAPDMASRATWADRYRDSDRGTTRVRYEHTREWHFVNTELDDGDIDAACHGHRPLPAGTAASAGPADDCVVDKIVQFERELADPATPHAEKLLALKFLLHFIGDAHQPLHAADHHDSGGNLVPVVPQGTHDATNLHA